VLASSVFRIERTDCVAIPHPAHGRARLCATYVLMVAVAFPGILTVAAGVSREVEGAAWTKQKKSSSSKMDPLVKFCAVGLGAHGPCSGELR